MTRAFAPTLFGGGDPQPDPGFAGARRLELDASSWLDVVPGWLAGADTWFEAIVADAPWNQRRRRMYDQDVMEPRLLPARLAAHGAQVHPRRPARQRDLPPRRPGAPVASARCGFSEWTRG